MWGEKSGKYLVDGVGFEAHSETDSAAGSLAALSSTGSSTTGSSSTVRSYHVHGELSRMQHCEGDAPRVEHKSTGEELEDGRIELDLEQEVVGTEAAVSGRVHSEEAALRGGMERGGSGHAP